MFLVDIVLCNTWKLDQRIRSGKNLGIVLLNFSCKCFLGIFQRMFLSYHRRRCWLNLLDSSRHMIELSCQRTLKEAMGSWGHIPRCDSKRSSWVKWDKFERIGWWCCPQRFEFPPQNIHQCSILCDCQHSCWLDSFRHSVGCRFRRRMLGLRDIEERRFLKLDLRSRH